LEQSASTLIPYLISNQLTTEDPYSPLPWEEMERVTKANGSNTLPTLSSLCTATSLSGSVKIMLREFDLDAMLLVLHQCDYNNDEALKLIQKKPEDFLTRWTQTEKDAFDYSFQRHAGSLRMVFKRVKGSKSVPEIVDYHYRFKIPDQFRIFHNDKRDMSVRMVETLESRRNINSTIPIDNSNGTNGKSHKKKQTDGKWLRTSIDDVTGALKERRVDAKLLLLEIESAISPEKYSRLVDIITDFYYKSSEEVLQEVEEILEGHSKLQAQFIDFLPDHLR
jgi:predicted transcriptional regulator